MSGFEAVNYLSVGTMMFCGVIVALVLWPHLAVDVGFAMSVAATAALIAWSPPLRDGGCRAGRRGRAGDLTLSLNPSGSA